MVATRLCTEQDCNKPTSRPNHPLCPDCYRKQRSSRKSGTGWDQAPLESGSSPPPAGLVRAVELVRRNISEHADACANNETNTVQYLVEPMLIGLGWDIRNPNLVIKEYRVEGKKRSRRNIRVDIALLGGDRRPFAFIEVKRLDRDYDPQYMGQLENYVSHMDIGVAVLTNGRHWRISNVLDGIAQPLKIVDIQQGGSQSVAETLNGFIGRTASLVNLPPTRVSRPPARPPTTEQITDALKDYRGREAQRRRRPAFTIFNDETIALIAERKPASSTELRSIRGVGSATVRQHGEAILKIVAGETE